MTGRGARSRGEEEIDVELGLILHSRFPSFSVLEILNAKGLRVSIAPINTVVISGANATLTCFTRGKNIRTIEWYKDKKKLPDEMQSKSTSRNRYINTLFLTGVEKTSVGTYECRGFKDFANRSLTQYPGYWLARTEVHELGKNKHAHVFI